MIKTRRARPSLVAATALALASQLAPSSSEAGPGASTAPTIVRYQDGTRQVEARRQGAPATDAWGRTLTPVSLRYPHRPSAVTAAVDRSAVVQLPDHYGEDRAQVQQLLDGLGAHPVRPLMPSIGLWLVEDTTGGDGLDVAERLARPEARERGLRQAVPNLYLRLEHRDPFIPNDPRFGGQWYFDKLNMPEAWGLERGDPNVSAVIVDSGCDLTHPDLVAKLDPGRDVVDGDDDPSYNPAEPGSEHGTSCAGIVAAHTDNGEGMAGGCPECRLRCVRLVTGAAQPISATVEAFNFALQVDAAVVSNSWGYVSPLPVPQPIAAAINNVFDNGRGGLGALVVFAAGNDDRELGEDEIEAVRGVLCIGAINNFDEQTPFTNWGSPVDLVAPTGTLTTDIAGPGGSEPGDYTTTFGGTSSACPVAAGIAGLLASAGTGHTSAQIYQLLIDTARAAPFAQPDANGHDLVFGYGIIEPVAALKAALGIVDPEEQPDGGTGGSGGMGGTGSGAAPPAPSSLEADGGCALGSPSRGGAALGTLALLLALGLLGRRARGSSRPQHR